MSSCWINRAAIGLDSMIAHIKDRLNGNYARRRAIKQRLHLAMMATERHQLVAARATQKRTAGFTQHSALHWRTEFHRNAV